MRLDKYQFSLIALGIVVTLLLGVFFYRELFPEYKIYQNDYVALEKFRSTYTGEPPPAFKEGIRQIVQEREDKGPSLVDRCVSCHVALQFSHFSPTKIAEDINGRVLYDEQGLPLQVPNENYIWAKLNQAIDSSKDSKEIEYLKSLKVAKVGEHVYDVTKVLAAHPLIGRETRPFEFHPLEEYGCTSCHNGNGSGLTTPKAHGPVFDGEYEIEFMGHAPQFTESDPANDPKFSKVFNHKPGHELLFQTTPIFVGSLIQAKCVQCHQSSQSTLQSAANAATALAGKRQRSAQSLQNALNQEQELLVSYLEIKQSIQKVGVAQTIAAMRQKTENYSLPGSIRERVSHQIDYLMRLVGGNDGLRSQNAQPAADVVLMDINGQLEAILGSKELVQSLEKVAVGTEQEISQVVSTFVVDNSKNPQAKGTLFSKLRSLELEQELIAHIQDTKSSFETAANDPQVVNALTADIDLLTKDFTHGQNLFISQACYACHRIAGFARGGVGPELTQEGKYYPWFIKESIVWPQADLPTSTMPNFKMDHEEVEDLVTYLLGQHGSSNAVSPVDYKIRIQEWESGKKQSWEKPITPSQVHDLDYSMTVFATEGCAACHRLKGFESNVGFRAEKEQKDQWSIASRIKENDWFKQLVPEMIIGSQLVQVLEEHSDEIDQRIIDGVRENALLEQIEKHHPGIIESYNTNFKYAMRAKNSEYTNLANQEKDPAKKAEMLEKLDQWKQRVRRVMMAYIQEYGLGRLIGPRPNWSGVYRTDEWLMEHFRNPSNHVPKSIMPVFPFDDTKFYALTHMLDTLGRKNRDALRAIWQHSGFNPELAYQTYCSQCHGEFLAGNGPVSEWIYPIPKNLRNADFLRNLTKERVIYSITHGIKGTPMPPWGEVGADKPHGDNIPVLNAGEIQRLADWLFFNIPGSTVIPASEDVPKWRYEPEDVLHELKKEGGSLKNIPPTRDPLSFLPNGSEFYAALIPRVFPKTAPEEVADVFDIIPDQTKGPDQNLYYIKKEYYTPENLRQGQEFFEINCAICHGREGEGAGLRAGIMQDAKPRMFTNLGWINSRDDLRLLRSIKFGVPGTAMTPWGDLTTSFQRMQLVMFIRSLSKEHKKRDELASALFQAFDSAKIAVETERVTEFSTITKLKEELAQTDADVKRLYNESKEGAVDSKEAVVAYEKKLELLNQLREQEKKDASLKELKAAIASQSDIYQSIGTNMIVQDFEGSALEKVIQMIQLNKGRVSLDNDRLMIKADANKDAEVQKIAAEIIESISHQIQDLEKARTLQEGKIPSQEQKQTLSTIKSDLTALTKLKIKFLSGMEQIRILQEKEMELYKKYDDIRR